MRRIKTRFWGEWSGCRAVAWMVGKRDIKCRTVKYRDAANAPISVYWAGLWRARLIAFRSEEKKKEQDRDKKYDDGERRGTSFRVLIIVIVRESQMRPWLSRSSIIYCRNNNKLIIYTVKFVFVRYRLDAHKNRSRKCFLTYYSLLRKHMIISFDLYIIIRRYKATTFTDVFIIIK